jgi:GNAT superfamily N-acetyltransferase/RimJ/RimL family protein N-acetyltransferase
MVQIERFDPAHDTGRLEACYQIATAADRLDEPALPPPSPGAFAGWWSGGYNGNPRQAWLGTSDSGTPVGCYLLTLPDRENQTMAYLRLTVAPQHRRSGAGTVLLAHAAEEARRAGRLRLAGEARDGGPGAAFAAAAGATSGIAEVLRVLQIDAELRARLVPLRAEARNAAAGAPAAQATATRAAATQATATEAGASRAGAGGYSLLSWLGPVPEEFLDDVVVISDAMADAPHDEGTEHEHWDGDRIRNMERVSADAGQRFHSVAARHDATGRLVAHTQLVTDAAVPGWGFQQLTAVLPEHRGHRLGLLVKVGMLDQLADWEPGLRSIVTGNADANKYMIAINAALGFEVASVYRNWQLDLAAS